MSASRNDLFVTQRAARVTSSLSSFAKHVILSIKGGRVFLTLVAVRKCTIYVAKVV
jgi:hypothetical protein